jgi:hypothetical protein
VLVVMVAVDVAIILSGIALAAWLVDRRRA